MEATGTRLGRYRLAQRLGEGGMGVVYLGVDDGGRAVAIKVLRPHVAADPVARHRLAREVDTLRRVRHPRVAAVLDADVDCDSPYLVTEFVPGPPLDEHVGRHGPLDRTALAQLGDGLGEALAAIHGAGVVHRDLKPGNVLMPDGEPVVIDFGIAHVADDARLTSTGLVMGTPGYLSPEVLDGAPVTQATDWWGWAATMAFAATGRPPFGRGPAEAVLDRVRRGRPDVDGAPAALVDVLVRGLDVDPARRPRPGELRAALAELRSGGGTAGDGAARGGTAREPEPATQALPAAMPEPATEPLAVGRQEAATEAIPLPNASRPQPPVWAPRPAEPAPWRPEPADEPHARQPPAVRTGRTGTLLAGLAALAAVAAVAPVMAAILGFTGSVLARTVDRAHGALLRRRHERGPRRSDPLVAAAASPGHLLGAGLASVPAALLPALVGIATAFLVGWLVGGAAVVPGEPVSLAAGAVAAALTGWWGPGGASVRRGSRSLARAVAPGRTGARVAVALLLIVVGAAALVVLGGSSPDWSPLNGPPTFGVPEIESPAILP